MTLTSTRCRVCRGDKPPRLYLCHGCWDQLPALARRLLNRRDSRAFARLRELHRQLDADVPLAEITVSP